MPSLELSPDPDEESTRPRAGTFVDTLGTVVPVSLVLARSEEVAVLVTKVVVYPAGFSFDVICVHRSPEPLPPVQSWSMARRGPVDPTVLRFGLRFADGSKVTNLELGSRPSPGQGPILRPTGGTGVDRTYTLGYWCQPLPPEGRMAFVCEWPRCGLPLTETYLEGGLLRTASRRATPIWRDDG